MEDLIPLAGILMIVALVLGPIWLGTRYKSEERARMHETLRRAFDKGQPIPPEIVDTLAQDKPRPTPERDFRVGVILIAVAIAMLVLGWTIYAIEDEAEALAAFGGMAAFPGLIGLVFLAFSFGLRGRSSDAG